MRKAEPKRQAFQVTQGKSTKQLYDLFKLSTILGTQNMQDVTGHIRKLDILALEQHAVLLERQEHIKCQEITRKYNQAGCLANVTKSQKGVEGEVPVWELLQRAL